jgi:hypothetical protein
MKTLIPILIVLLSCFVIFSCSKDENPPTQPTNGTLQGQVTNSTGDTVIVGAIVSTSPATGSVSTNAQGNYTLSDVPAGQYTVTASKGGYNPASITVTVAGGKTTSANIHLTYQMGNQPPNPATLISPMNGSIDRPTTTVLRWSCSDPDGDALTYNVYLGKTTPPATIISLGQTDTNIVRSGLDTATTYYWKVIAKDHHSDSSISSISSFTTHGDTLGKIGGKVTNATGDTAIVGALVTTNPPTSSVNTNAEGNYLIPYVLPDQYTVTASKSGYNPGNVNVTVGAGQTTIADIHLVRNNPPTPPSIISPADGAIDQRTTVTLSWTCSDPDGDPLTYDVYFDKTNPPTSVVSSNQSSTNLLRSTLDTATTYYWEVVAKDNRGGLTSSAIWSFTTLRDTIPTLGLVSYYPFIGNTDDESGNNNNPTIVGNVQFVPDRFNTAQRAFYFNGTTRLFFQGTIGLQNADASISAWVIPERYTGGTHSYAAITIYDKSNERSIRLWVDYNGLGLPVGNKIVGETRSSNNQSYDSYFFTDNTMNWMHAVVVIRVDRIELWINGEMKSSQGVNGSGSYYNLGLGVGGNQQDNTQLYKGRIDDIRIYNRALSTAEILQLYHEGGW